MFKKHSQIKKAVVKTTSIIIVLLMLLTVFSTVVSAGIIFRRDNENQDSSKDKPLINSIKTRIQERIEMMRERFRSLSERIRQKIDVVQDAKSENIFSDLTTEPQGNSLFSPITFYTNYNGTEKTSTLRLFSEIKIDINGDSKNDIGVMLQIFPGIVAPLTLSINYKLSIRRLPDSDIDTSAYFKAMSQLNFPGILSKSLAGDKLEFGYESPEGESIPDKCDVTYKLVPHIFSFRKTSEPDHIFVIETSSGSALNLIFGFKEADDGSEVFSKLLYTSVKESVVTFKRGIDSGVWFFEYERTVSPEKKVDLYIGFIKGEDKTYAYALDLPNHVGFSLTPGNKGKAEFSTSSSISEIGLCDDIDNPKNKVYFSNMFTNASLEWDYDPFLFLDKGKFNANVYTVGGVVSFNAHLVGASEGTADFSITPDANIINASLELDLSKGYFKFYRNEFDLSVSFSVSILNESVSSFLSTLKGSFNFARLSEGPFKILFKELSKGKVDVNLSGKSFEIYDVDITGYSEMIGGNFSVSMDRFVKKLDGFMRVNLSAEKEGNNITGSCRFEIRHGAIIENLSLEINGFVFHRESINITGNRISNYNFSISIYDYDLFIAEDLSSGYIKINSSSSVIVSLDRYVWNESGVLLVHISGTIDLKTLGDYFYLSWETIDGNISFNMDGSGIVGLYDFNLYVKDKLNISISEISASFELNTFDKEGNLVLYLDSAFSGDIKIEGIDIDDLFDLTLKGSLHLVLDESTANGTINIGWNESGITAFDADFDADVSGSIDVTDFEFRYSTLVDISMARLFIDGGLNVNLTFIDGNVSIFADVEFSDIVISDLDIFLAISYPPIAISLNTSDITFAGTGYINITYSDDVIIVDGAVYNNSNITINDFWFIVPGLFIEVYLKSFSICGPMTILFNIDTSKDIPFMIKIVSQEEITSDIIYLGYPGILQIFIYDLVRKGTDGYLGIGFNVATSQPVLDINQSSAYIGDLVVWFGDSFYFSDISIEGTAFLEGFLDIEAFTYIYLKGEIVEDTTITLKNMDIPLYGLCNISIVLEPGYLDFLMTQDGENFYFYFYSSSWITIKIDGKELVKLSGTLDVWFNLHQADDGTISFIMDAKEVSGAFILVDKLRFVGEINAFVDFRIKVLSDENVTTISDLYLNVTGELSAVIHIKTNETDWIPIYPFSTSGQVVLIRQGGLMGAPNIVDGFVVTTPGNYANLTFEAWYAPPLGENSETIGPYTYNISFDDETYYEVTTNDNRIVTGPHMYDLGNYTASVTVTPFNSSINPVSDDLSFEILQKITYLEISDKGPRNFLYSDVDEDGRLHTWFIVRNKAEEEYILEWEAYFVAWGINDTGMDPILDPESGVLGPGETVRVNVSFKPPADHKDHNTIYVGAENTNYTILYEGDKGDYDNFIIFIKQNLSVFPSAIYLPDLTPGGQISSSIWIHNNKKEPLNWSITDIPNNNYSFSSTSGTIPPKGSKVVHFTVRAPSNNESVDLSGDIVIIDDNDPQNVVKIYVDIKTKGYSGNSYVGITEYPNGNVSITIGGLTEIHLDNFLFNINGIAGKINGHLFLDRKDSYVYINFTKGNFIGTFSVEGSTDFSIIDFIFEYGEIANIDISYLAGKLVFREGRSGNFSMMVDNSSVDVDVNMNINHSYTNFTLQGKFNMSIFGNSNGTMWFDWDRTGDKPNVSIGGNLYREGTCNITVEGLLLELDALTVSADLLIFSGSGGDITVSEGKIVISAGIDTVVVQNLSFDLDFETFPFVKNSFLLSGVFDLIGNTDLNLTIDEDAVVDVNVEGNITISISDFLLDINRRDSVLSWRYLAIYADAGADLHIGNSIVTINGTGELNLLINDLSLETTNIELHIPKIDIELRAEADELKINLAKPLKDPEVTRVLPSNLSIYIDDTLQLVALVNMPEYINKIEWESSNVAVATVDSTGKVTAHSAGTTTITASLEGGSASATVNVIGKNTEFHIIPQMATLKVGDQFKLTTKHEVGSVSWSSSDENVASINEITGVVTVNGIGTATITAYDEENKSDTSKVIVEEPTTTEKNVFTIEGKFSLSGGLLLVANYYNEDNAWFLSGKINGSCNISDFKLEIINPANKSFSLVAPNYAELKDALIELSKGNETSPGVLSINGEIIIVPQYLEGWGNIGLGISIDDLTDNTNLFRFTVESLYLNVRDSNITSPGGEDEEIDILELSNNSGIKIKIDSELGYSRIYSEDDSITLQITNMNLYVIKKLNLSCEYLEFNKIGKIDWLIGIGVGNLSLDPSGWVLHASFKHYANVNSSLGINNLKVGIYWDGYLADMVHRWITLPIKWLNLTRHKQGYEIVNLYFDFESENFIISADLNSTWNSTIEVGTFFGKLEGEWYINSDVSSNFTIELMPDEVWHGYLTVHEPGMIRCFELEHIGKVGKYFGLKFGEMELTPGKIKMQLSSGELYIENQGVHGQGASITFEYTRWRSVTIGSFEIEPGLFNLSWEELTDEDFYTKFVIKNGIFDSEALVFAIKIGEYKLTIDRRNRDLINYNNTITIKTRWNGPSTFDNALYINTEDYINMTRTTIAFYKNDTKLFYLNSLINIKIKYIDRVFGFINGEHAKSGRIWPKLTTPGIFNFLFILGVGNINGDYQELSLSGMISEQKLGIRYDATNCNDDIIFDDNSFEFWKYKITPSLTLNAQSYLDFEMDLNLTATPEEGSTGNIYAYVDTNGESLGQFEIEFYNEDDDRGLKITADTFMADGFNISCQSVFKNGHWRPKWSTLGKTGDINGLNLEIWVKFKVLDDWMKIYDSEGLVVILENQEYQVTVNQELQFQVYVYCGTAPYTYNWILPGGLSSSNQTPSYTFDSEGVFQVNVAVTDITGKTGSATSMVYVSE